MKKLSCHCGAVEAEVKMPLGGIKKIMRCNCSICKKKGYIIGVLGPDDFKLTKGEDKLSLYQFYTILLNITFAQFVEFTLITDLEVIQKYLV